MTGDQRLGAAARNVRLRRDLRQADVATRAAVSRATVSALERGHLDSLSLRAIRAICAGLDIRVELAPRWRGGDLDRLMNARHSAIHELVARMFARLPEWTIVPEVSFSVFGERGIVDILAWHAASRTVLVIELKTDIVDVQETLGTLDRKGRLAKRIAADRGWQVDHVAVWLAVADSRTAHRHVAAHRTMLGNAFQADGGELRKWLRRPTGRVSALSFVGRAGLGVGREIAGRQRVRRLRVATAA